MLCGDRGVFANGFFFYQTIKFFITVTYSFVNPFFRFIVGLMSTLLIFILL